MIVWRYCYFGNKLYFCTDKKKYHSQINEPQTKKNVQKKDVSWVFAGLFVIRKLAVDIAETVDAWHTK